MKKPTNMFRDWTQGDLVINPDGEAFRVVSVEGLYADVRRGDVAGGLKITRVVDATGWRIVSGYWDLRVGARYCIGDVRNVARFIGASSDFVLFERADGAEAYVRRATLSDACIFPYVRPTKPKPIPADDKVLAAARERVATSTPFLKRGGWVFHFRGIAEAVPVCTTVELDEFEALVESAIEKESKLATRVAVDFCQEYANVSGTVWFKLTVSRYMATEVKKWRKLLPLFV